MRRQDGVLAAITAGGFALRVVVAQLVQPICPRSADAYVRDCVPINGDTLYHLMQGTMLADGRGFASPTAYLRTSELHPGAGDPPLYAVFLAVLHRIGLETPTQQRLASAAVGAMAIFIVGVLATRLGGRRAGVVAAVLAAVSPSLWLSDIHLLSESIYGTIVAGLLLCAYRLWDRPTLGRAAALGAVGAMAALTRGEGLLLLLMVLAPFAWASPRTRALASTRDRMLLSAVAMGIAAATISPWVAYNLSRFDEPVLLTSGTGTVLRAGSCHDAFYGEYVGYYSFQCLSVEGTPVDEAATDAIMRDRAVDYLGDQLDRLPVVMWARVGRVWDVYRPFQNARLNDWLEQRGVWESYAALWMWWGTLALAPFGLATLTRRRLPWSPMVAMALAVTATAAMTFGLTRYRVPLDVAVIVLAGIGTVALWDRIVAWRAGASEAAGATP